MINFVFPFAVTHIIINKIRKYFRKNFEKFGKKFSENLYAICSNFVTWHFLIYHFSSSYLLQNFVYLSIIVMRSEKPYTKLEYVILRKHALRWFGQKVLIFGFQWKYVESISSNILMQIWVSSDDSTCSYNDTCMYIHWYTTQENHTQSHQRSYYQTRLPLVMAIFNQFNQKIDVS